jgi:hypothetical protein
MQQFMQQIAEPARSKFYIFSAVFCGAVNATKTPALGQLILNIFCIFSGNVFLMPQKRMAQAAMS